MPCAAYRVGGQTGTARRRNSPRPRVLRGTTAGAIQPNDGPSVPEKREPANHYTSDDADSDSADVTGISSSDLNGDSQTDQPTDSDEERCGGEEGSGEEDGGGGEVHGGRRRRAEHAAVSAAPPPRWPTGSLATMLGTLGMHLRPRAGAPWAREALFREHLIAAASTRRGPQAARETGAAKTDPPASAPVSPQPHTRPQEHEPEQSAGTGVSHGSALTTGYSLPAPPALPFVVVPAGPEREAQLRELMDRDPVAAVVIAIGLLLLLHSARLESALDELYGYIDDLADRRGCTPNARQPSTARPLGFHRTDWRWLCCWASPCTSSRRRGAGVATRTMAIARPQCATRCSCSTASAARWTRATHRL